MKKLTKKELREKILKLLKQQRCEERQLKSLEILAKLFNIKEFQRSSNILFYLSIDGEVNTIPMITQAQQLGKTIALPKVNTLTREIIPVKVSSLENDLETGAYGIQEPKHFELNRLSLQDIDLVIVPGVAFDRKNNRLGRGGGYYDRFLKTLSANIPTIGLAFDIQMVDHIPQEEYDLPVSKVLFN